MKYASPYYSKLKKFSYYKTNMNQLCWDIEHWEKKIIFKNSNMNFNYNILIDDSIPFDINKYNKLIEIFKEYNKEMSSIMYENKKFKELDKEWIVSEYSLNFYNMIKNNEYEDDFDIIIYDKYRKKCNDVCNNQNELANLITKICYEEFPNKPKKIMWKVASNGLLNNLRLHREDVYLPSKDQNGKYEFLGKYYDMVKVDVINE